MPVDFNNPIEESQFREKVSTLVTPQEIDLYIEGKKNQSLGARRTIESGDTLGGIAQQTNTTIDELAGRNKISDPNTILAGRVLDIPEQPQEVTGDGPRSKDLDTQDNIFPKKFKVTQAFGNINPSVEVFSKGFNRGTDYATPNQTPIAAPRGEWIVTEAFGTASNKGHVGNSANSGWGNSVKLTNRKSGITIRFSHLSPGLNVRPGQIVKGGQVLGLSGGSGNSTGFHTDIEVTNRRGRLIDVRRSGLNIF